MYSCNVMQIEVLNSSICCSYTYQPYMKHFVPYNNSIIYIPSYIDECMNANVFIYVIELCFGILLFLFVPFFSYKKKFQEIIIYLNTKSLTGTTSLEAKRMAKKIVHH